MKTTIALIVGILLVVAYFAYSAYRPIVARGQLIERLTLESLSNDRSGYHRTVLEMDSLWRVMDAEYLSTTQHDERIRILYWKHDLNWARFYLSNKLTQMRMDSVLARNRQRMDSLSIVFDLDRSRRP